MSACSALASTEPVPPRPVECVARNMGVEPFLFARLACAPPARSAATAAAHRVRAAMCSGATPPPSTASGSAPAWIRHVMVVACACGFQCVEYAGGGSVERFGTAAILCVHVGGAGQELVDDFDSVGRRGNVQWRIASVDVARDLVQEVWLLDLAGRPHPGYPRARPSRTQLTRKPPHAWLICAGFQTPCAAVRSAKSRKSRGARPRARCTPSIGCALRPSRTSLNR